MNSTHTVAPDSIEYYRYSVRILSQELWEETDPQWRMNLALQLAEASTHLARMESEQFQALQEDKLK
ncbi:hypothetical protein HC931_25700 [Candidatus Gracilibacteria bacterium]|nr:hypothetical protein [Candidatus Gracilibacteria bacterium]NJM90025.1 hypothetical protein [Hydrococcus sp. RU_2_2]NJP21885.1 hypothetical protein [Hydrococcus sp. CRU_1_1]NJQ96951.1 hypothetical protein [Hydrococcus sp. CSU_1_8]